MPELDVYIGPMQAGSMNDRIEAAIHRRGMSTELRDVDESYGLWAKRLGCTRLNLIRIPGNRIIGGRSFRNTQRVLHTLVASDDGHLYHAVGEPPFTFQPVPVYADNPMVWDETYVAKFVAWRDWCYMAVSQPGEVSTVPAAGTQNLRFDSIPAADGTYRLYGVSLAKPGAACTVADGGAGDVLEGSFDYLITFLDYDTGLVSDESAVASIQILYPTVPNVGPVPSIIGAGAGTKPAGYYEYCYTFYEPATGRESPPSPISTITIEAADAPANILLSGIETCKDAGAWNRRVYRRDNGGAAGTEGFNLLATIADNVTLVLWDNAATATGALYAEGGRQIQLTNIPVYGGGGTPANGRTIHRQIWRSDDGAPYALLDTLTDNVTTTYTDNNAEVAGEPYSRRQRIPCCGLVAVTPDNLVVWANDRESVLPAIIYLSRTPDDPESLGEYRYAGNHDDPIVDLVSARDGIIVPKHNAWHYLDRQCARCERLVEGPGAVSPQVTFNLDTRSPFLSSQGPRCLMMYGERDAPFVGPDRDHFCLADTWRNVVEERLYYATGVHWPDAGVVIWGVQMCHEWPTSPPHNDTAIVWDYASTSQSNPGGTVYIISLVGWDAGWQKPCQGSSKKEPYAAFAFGGVCKMFDGQHGDNTTSLIQGTILAASGTVVTIDGTILEGQDVVGSTLYIWSGAGTHFCRPVEACENARALIVTQGGSGAPGQLTLAGELGIAAGSKFWIGGFPFVVEFMVNLPGDPDSIKTYTSATVEVIE